MMALLAASAGGVACDGDGASVTPPSTSPPATAAPAAEDREAERDPDPGTPPAETSPSPAAPVPTAAKAPAESHALGPHTLRLETSDTACTVHVTTDGGESVALPLSLEPPCYWLRWPYPPPADPAESGGQPRGVKDQPMAWEYPDLAEPTTAVVVIGGGLDEPDPDRRARLQAEHCADRTQAVLLTEQGARASKRVAQGSVSCERSGTDERELWLFAHEG